MKGFGGETGVGVSGFLGLLFPEPAHSKHTPALDVPELLDLPGAAAADAVDELAAHLLLRRLR